MKVRMLAERSRVGTYSALILSPDGVRLSVSAHSAAERAARIAEYVGERCEYTLWPDAAAEVRALIEARNAEAAIRVYFANVGDRWDDEMLECCDPVER